MDAESIKLTADLALTAYILVHIHLRLAKVETALADLSRMLRHQNGE